MSKSLRDTKLYKELMKDTYRAVEYAEGFGEGEEVPESHRLIAWQVLHDTKLGYQLQGWFGRMLRELIEQGFIEE